MSSNGVNKPESSPIRQEKLETRTRLKTMHSQDEGFLDLKRQKDEDEPSYMMMSWVIVASSLVVILIFR